MPLLNKSTLRCACGNVEIELAGAPIVTNVCYCNDCERGSRQIEALPGAAAVREADGGTAYVIYRKDRVSCGKGASLLKALKLTEKSATNRVVASCCNSAMMLNFDDSKHWVDLYRTRFQDPPPVQMNVCTKSKSGNGNLAHDVPSYGSFPLKFVAKLLSARLAMLLGR